MTSLLKLVCWFWSKVPVFVPKIRHYGFFFKILAKVQYDSSPQSSQRQNLEIFMNSHQEIRQKLWNWLRKCRFLGQNWPLWIFFDLFFQILKLYNRTDKVRPKSSKCHLFIWSYGPKWLKFWKMPFFHQFWCSLYNSAIFKIYASKLKIETLLPLCLYITCRISDCFEKVFGAHDHFRTVGCEHFSPKITSFGTIPPLWILDLQFF